MNSVGQTWVVVLAAGEGSRLRDWTRTGSGICIPKQFCSLRGGLSLMEAALSRASAITSRDRICAIVAAEHRAWWEAPLLALPASNVIVQPENRGTGAGMLFPLMQILHRDPDANVLWLPSDHYVQHEDVLSCSMRAALAESDRAPNTCILLGMEPEEADPELGYIVPSDTGTTELRDVSAFVEKPSVELAQVLIESGALWNGFIIASRGAALLELFKKRVPNLVRAMRTILCDVAATRLHYAQLPIVDFSRHIANGSASDLRVMRVPKCGWSDLGTPARLAATLRKLPEAAPEQPAKLAWHPALDLSSQRHML
jgi:mannose-1-phosphate guanylyltransferase